MVRCDLTFGMSKCQILIFVSAVGIFTSLASCNSDISNNFDGLVPKCKTKSSNFDQCIAQFLQESIKYATKGIEKLSVPSLDPYFIPELKVVTPEGITVLFTNSSCRGTAAATVTKFRSDAKVPRFEIYLRAPKLVMSGSYEMKGKLISQLQIRGAGKYNVTMRDVHSVVKVEGELAEANRDLNATAKIFHVVVKQLVLQLIKVKNVQFWFSQVFQNNQLLGEAVNQFLNENWTYIYERMKPILETEMSRHAKDLIRKYFQNIPYNSIVPDMYDES